MNIEAATDPHDGLRAMAGIDHLFQQLLEAAPNPTMQSSSVSNGPARVHFGRQTHFAEREREKEKKRPPQVPSNWEHVGRSVKLRVG